MAKSWLGQIPDDHFENDHSPPKTEKSPMPKSDSEWCDKLMEDDDG